MDYEIPQSIELLDDEQEIYDRIEPYIDGEMPQHENWHHIADDMESLVASLMKRNAVPDIRLRLFGDPELAETGKKSRKQVFESNGTSGTDITRHPHFLSYIRHFIHGPNLPVAVIEGLCTILNEDRGTSGMVFDQYRKHARDSVRKHDLDYTAPTEFFRLGIEIGMGKHSARALRDAAKSVRK